MGFTLTRHDNDVWIKPRGDGYDCVSTHADDFIVVATDSRKCVDQIKQTFNLRSEGNIDYFLVHNVRIKRMVCGKLLPKNYP